MPSQERILYILGAGVDCAFNLPVMANLYSCLTKFTLGPGKGVEAAIRSHVKHARVGIASKAEDDAEDIGAKLLGSHSAVLDRLKSVLDPLPDNTHEGLSAVKEIVRRLIGIRDSNYIDADTADKIAVFAGSPAQHAEDSLMDESRSVMRPTARGAMRNFFQLALGEIPGLSKTDKAMFESLLALVSNFEEMLGFYFSGFYTRNPGNQKRYFYYSWLLWAYLRYCVGQANPSKCLSFYDTLAVIAGNDPIITFNYTNFFQSGQTPTLGYFHGNFDSYILFGDRELVQGPSGGSYPFIDAWSAQDLEKWFKSFASDWSSDIPNVRLPALIPPISMKPLICAEYLDCWYWCAQQIREADVIFIIGYSFSSVDDHFNDLVKKNNKARRIIIINPSLAVRNEVSRCLGYTHETWHSSKIGRFDCHTLARIVIAYEYAENVTPDDILAFL
jgi:hypothetical protein